MNIQKNNLGNITIDKHAIAQIVHESAMETYGLVGFATKNNVIAELLKYENATKGVVVEENEDGTLTIDVYAIIQYGNNISTVAENIIDKVKFNIKNLTSLEVKAVNINVQGVRVK